jgi:hypothetical protein
LFYIFDYLQLKKKLLQKFVDRADFKADLFTMVLASCTLHFFWLCFLQASSFNSLLPLVARWQMTTSGGRQRISQRERITFQKTLASLFSHLTGLNWMMYLLFNWQRNFKAYQIIVDDQQ